LADRTPDAPLTIVCIPVYNDWEAAQALTRSLGAVAAGLDGPWAVLLVDDGSTDPPPRALGAPGLAGAEILRLRRNVGHQRAIALGLAYIHRRRPCRAVVVMDGDGQDAAEDVPRLLERCRDTGWGSIVFARRSRRSEDLLFQAGYHAFRALHRLLTGRAVEVGNFSVVPRPLLERVVGVSEIWNHYAAGVIHARLPVASVPIPRRRRLAGRTRMDRTALVVHGLSAISVYGATVGVRLLALTGALVAAAGGGLLAILGARALRPVAVPPWALEAAGFLAVGLLGLPVLSAVFVLVLLNARNAAPFLPIRDWEHYVIDAAPLALVPGRAGEGGAGAPERPG
jgi:hypothetical protein